MKKEPCLALQIVCMQVLALDRTEYNNLPFSGLVLKNRTPVQNEKLL